MYFITKEEDLIGKKIIFTHMAQFADALTIVTEDKGIFVVNQDGEETHVFNSGRALRYIKNSKWLVGKLNDCGIITNEMISSWEEEKERQRQETHRKLKEQEEQMEYKTYLRLKEKFENHQKEVLE